MISVSMCMIVKNEQDILKRCLDSYAGTYDELIIIDTGSTDNTKEIARQYTDKVYDYVWCNDFAAARNFAFSKAGCDYILSVDADEELDTYNNKALRDLKAAILPEIDIVQMYYVNGSDFNSVYNVHKELRPKLFKRIRTFNWISPIRSYMTAILRLCTSRQATTAKEIFPHISRLLIIRYILRTTLLQCFVRNYLYQVKKTIS